MTDISGIEFPRLRFASRAHLPLGKTGHDGIAEIVYYFQAGEENRFVLKRGDNLPRFQSAEEKSSDPVLCENVKALTFTYFDQEDIEFNTWDSDADTFGYATPKAVVIKLALKKGDNTLQFETRVNLPVVREEIENPGP